MGLFPQPRTHPPSHRSLRRSPSQRREDQEERRQRQEKRQAEPSRGPEPVDVAAQDSIFLEENAQASQEHAVESSASAMLPENDLVLVGSNEKADGVEENDGKVEDLGEEVNLEPPETADDVAMIARTASASNHRGLARKVLPDVLGLFNSRLWNLWSPNV
ncbi:uncharacterized protein Pyn_29386 [Prunus yedoensis var. nudiflora]|uniref:Uncharacterized protein n=1 Tax=Prunus yedoensis var. nudiflora TaxID=2094558 RepID=A0A314YFG6_PRUYE|nr:uncharacterized protein Pyn_29386 [Prunus yedoensis var. nudiflora]